MSSPPSKGNVHDSSSDRSHHHSCVAVDDLSAAIDYFSTRLGIEFTPPVTVTMRSIAEHKTTEHQVKFVYSNDRYLELLQTEPGEGVFNATTNEGFHHLGQIAEAPLDEAIEAAVARGEELECELYVGNVLAAAFFKPNTLRPIRLELLSPALSAVRR